MPENIGAFCLICQTSKCLDFIDVLSEMGIKLKICQIIYKHFGIQLNEYHLQNDNLGHQQFICSECWSITESFHKLFEKVQELSFVIPTIKEIDEDDHLNCVENVKKEENLCDDSSKTVIIECGNDTNFTSIKNEVANDNIITSIKRNTRNCYLNKIETVVFEDNVIINDDVVVNEETSTKLNNTTRNAKKRIVKSKIKNIKKQTNYCLDTDKDDDEYDYVDNDNNNDEESTHENNENDKEYNEIDTKPKRQKYSKKLKLKKLLPKRKANKSPEDIEKENQQIRDFFKMSCEICESSFFTFTDAQNHYLQHHKQTGYLVCCKKKFFRRGLISDHISRHLNPNAFKCTKCNKIYVDKFALRNHMDQHAPIDKREYKCDICTSSFTKLFKLSQHIRVTHCTSNDKKFQCPECDKSFVIKSKLSSHIRGVHEFAYAHICHICAKTFKSKQVYELHQREHLNIEIPKLQCKVCGAWLKHEHSLRNHMARHSDCTATCEICNKVTSNRQALGNHMRYVHSERTHRCTMCDKAFKKAIGLKEHLASHTGEDLYTCAYCPKTFKSSANMHSHRKKVHPIEWQSDKIKRQKT